MKLAAIPLTACIIVGLSSCDRAAPSNEIAALDSMPSDQDFALYLERRKGTGQTGKVLEQARQSYFDKHSLAKALENERPTDPIRMQEALRDYRAELIVNEYFDDFLHKAVTSQAAKEYFEINQAQYTTFKVHVARILFSNGIPDESGVDPRLTRAVDAHKELMSGASFESLAAKLSDDRNSKGKGGDLGWVNSGDLPVAVANKIKAMKRGETTPPIGTRDGYQIVRLLADPEFVVPPYEEVEAKVMAKLRYDAKAKEITRLLQSVAKPESKS